MSDAPKPLWAAAKPNRLRAPKGTRRQTTMSLDAFLAGGLQALQERTGVPQARLFDDALALLLAHYRPVLEAEDRLGAYRAMQRLRVVHPKPAVRPAPDDEPEVED